MAERTVPANPKARVEGIVVRELPDEVLIYDMETHKAVCLNSTAAEVWRLCDGRRTASDIRKTLEKSAKGSVPEELVWLALEQLDKDKLLVSRVTRPAALVGVSRREMIRKVGLAAAIALPVVVSLVAPTAAQAGGSGCVASGGPCNVGGDCCSNSCLSNVCA
jgi:hypothetical protein